MRVVVRTPAEKVTEYDLPGVDSMASDEEVLAAAAAAAPLRDEYFEVIGAPYVFARGQDDLAAAGKRLQQAEDRLDGEKATAKELARQFYDRGMSKQAIHAALGITRVTLDAWLGDDARRRRKG